MKRKEEKKPCQSSYKLCKVLDDVHLLGPLGLFFVVDHFTCRHKYDTLPSTYTPTQVAHFQAEPANSKQPKQTVDYTSHSSSRDSHKSPLTRDMTELEVGNAVSHAGFGPTPILADGVSTELPLTREHKRCASHPPVCNIVS